MIEGEARRLGRNFGVIAAAQAVSQILAFVVSLSVARALGVEEYGVFVFAFAFPSWFVMFVSFGLDAVLTVDVAADRSRAGSYLTAVTAIRVPLSVAAAIALWIALQFVFPNPSHRLVVFVIGISSLLGAFLGAIPALFRAFERLEYSAFVSVVGQAAIAGSALALLAFGFGVFQVSLVFLGGTLLNAALSLALLRTRFVWFERKVDRVLMLRVLRRAIPFILGAVVGTLMATAGPVLLALLVDPVATGHFSAAYALVVAVLAPLSIYNMVFLPAMSRLSRESPALVPRVILKSQKLFFVLGFPAAIGGWFYAKDLVTLFYGEGFLESALSLEILILTVAVSTALLGISTALTATNHQTLNLGIGAVATTANVVLCLALIPRYGHVGASYAFLGATLLGGVLDAFAMKRLLARPDFRETLARPVLAGLGMVALLFILQTPALWIGVMAGGSFYFGVLLALGGARKEDWSLVRSALRGAFFR